MNNGHGAPPSAHSSPMRRMKLAHRMGSSPRSAHTASWLRDHGHLGNTANSSPTTSIMSGLSQLSGLDDLSVLSCSNQLTEEQRFRMAQLSMINPYSSSASTSSSCAENNEPLNKETQNVISYIRDSQVLLGDSDPEIRVQALNFVATIARRGFFALHRETAVQFLKGLSDVLGGSVDLEFVRRATSFVCYLSRDPRTLHILYEAVHLNRVFVGRLCAVLRCNDVRSSTRVLVTLHTLITVNAPPEWIKCVLDDILGQENIMDLLVQILHFAGFGDSNKNIAINMIRHLCRSSPTLKQRLLQLNGVDQVLNIFDKASSERTLYFCVEFLLSLTRIEDPLTPKAINAIVNAHGVQRLTKHGTHMSQRLLRLIVECLSGVSDSIEAREQGPYDAIDMTVKLLGSVDDTVVYHCTGFLHNIIANCKGNKEHLVLNEGVHELTHLLNNLMTRSINKENMSNIMNIIDNTLGILINLLGNHEMQKIVFEQIFTSHDVFACYMQIMQAQIKTWRFVRQVLMIFERAFADVSNVAYAINHKVYGQCLVPVLAQVIHEAKAFGLNQDIVVAKDSKGNENRQPMALTIGRAMRVLSKVAASQEIAVFQQIMVTASQETTGFRQIIVAASQEIAVFQQIRERVFIVDILYTIREAQLAEVSIAALTLLCQLSRDEQLAVDLARDSDTITLLDQSASVQDERIARIASSLLQKLNPFRQPDSSAQFFTEIANAFMLGETSSDFTDFTVDDRLDN